MDSVWNVSLCGWLTVLVRIVVGVIQEGRHDGGELVLHAVDEVTERQLHSLRQHLLRLARVRAHVSVLLNEVQQLRRVRHPERERCRVLLTLLSKEDRLQYILRFCVHTYGIIYSQAV